MNRRQMKATLLSLLSAAVALAGFVPHQRIDHEYRLTNDCTDPALTLGPAAGSRQPIYVTFRDDSTEGYVVIRSDIMFQKSTDGGRTWLSADVLVRRGEPHATYSDIATDSDGYIYVVYNGDSGSSRNIYCHQSSDGGATWSAPVRIDDYATSWLLGGPRIAADADGNLFCAWTDQRTGSLHVWSSVSTDRGATWSQNVRVDDDTTDMDCYQADVFVQPGTNHYLVAAEAPYYNGSTGFIVPPADPEALFSAIDRFYREARGAEFTRNVSEEKKKYSWENLVLSIEQLSS